MEPATQWPWWTRVRAPHPTTGVLMRLASLCGEKHTRRDRGKIAGGDRVMQHPAPAAALEPPGAGREAQTDPCRAPREASPATAPDGSRMNLNCLEPPGLRFFHSVAPGH